MRSTLSLHLVLLLPPFLLGCGGGGSSEPRPPDAPAALVANAGHGAFSIGWDRPARDGGAPVEDYVVVVVPELAGSGSTAHRTALYRGAVDGTRYTVSVRARNAVGEGPARTIEVTPRAYSAAGETALEVEGDASPTGIYDPSVLISGARAWMSYSSVDYHLDGEHRVQDVGLRLARSDDGGETWTYVRTVASPDPATIADPTRTGCGEETCSGWWAYETSWLVEDPTAPAASRFQLFAHQYFLYPPHATVEGQSATKYHLGAIVAWEAPSPDRLGDSPPRTALRWNFSPASFPGGQNVNDLTELAGCVVVAEGSATVRAGTMDLALACPYGSGTPLPQKIVLLRSTDRGRSFTFVSTLLDASDAAWLGGADHFTAPSLLAAADAAPVLIVTPSFGGIYGGCAVIPFSDPGAGTLFRVEGLPAVIRFEPTAEETMGGACAAARGLGVLRAQAGGLGGWPPSFGIRVGAPL